MNVNLAKDYEVRVFAPWQPGMSNHPVGITHGLSKATARTRVQFAKRNNLTAYVYRNGTMETV